MAREIDRRNFLRVGKRTLDVENGKPVESEESDDGGGIGHLGLADRDRTVGHVEIVDLGSDDSDADADETPE